MTFVDLPTDRPTGTKKFKAKGLKYVNPLESDSASILRTGLIEGKKTAADGGDKIEGTG